MSIEKYVAYTIPDEGRDNLDKIFDALTVSVSTKVG